MFRERGQYKTFYAWSFFHQLHHFGDRKKIPLTGPIPAVFFHKSSAHMRGRWFLANKNLRLILPVLVPYPWKFKNLMSYLQLSANQLMLWSVPNFFWPSVQSIWDTPGQNQLKNGRFLSKIRFKKIFWQKSSYFSGGQKGPLLTNSGAPNSLRWWP